MVYLRSIFSKSPPHAYFSVRMGERCVWNFMHFACFYSFISSNPYPQWHRHRNQTTGFMGQHIATHWRRRVLDMKILAFVGKRNSFSNLFFYPGHKYRHSILLFFFRQLSSGRYMMPFKETTTAAAACSMLGNEYGMTSHLHSYPSATGMHHGTC